MIYATTTDLAAYMGISVGSLPSNSSNMLERASELIDFVTLSRIDTTDSDELLVAKKATCAQVEFWIQINVESDIIGNSYNSISMGQLSMNGKFNTLAPRARRALQIAGMYNRGVRMI